MLFSVLIYASEDFSDALTPEEMENLLGHHRNFQQTVKSEGSFGAAVKLMSTGTAITLSKSGEETVMTDGPFAETKEQFMGFYLLETESLDGAIEAAKLLPLDRHKVEIRPIAYFDGADFRNGDSLVIDAP